MKSTTTGDRMRYVRQRLGMTQAEVAKKLGVTSASVSLYESNKTQMDYTKLRTFCEYFQVSNDWLLCQKPFNHIAVRGIKLHA